MDQQQLTELILQSLEHERGGKLVCQTALTCTIDRGLSRELRDYLQEITCHIAALEGACASLGINPEEECPGRTVIRAFGLSLVHAMEKALAAGDPAAAEIVACECVVLADTADRLDFQGSSGFAAKRYGAGSPTVEVEFDRASHSDDADEPPGWCRVLQA